jgi:hypothetical protein
VPGGFLRVNRQTVMGERVHDRRNEFGGTGVGLQGHVSNTARLVQVTSAVRICLCRCRAALPGKVDSPRDSRTGQGETSPSQGRLGWGTEHQEHDRGEAEKRGRPVTAEQRDSHSHAAQASGLCDRGAGDSRPSSGLPVSLASRAPGGCIATSRGCRSVIQAAPRAGHLIGAAVRPGRVSRQDRPVAGRRGGASPAWAVAAAAVGSGRWVPVAAPRPSRRSWGSAGRCR